MSSLQTLGGVLFATLLSASPALAQIRVGIAAPGIRIRMAPPAPIVERVPISPSPRHSWVGGHWQWNAMQGRHVWMRGYYHIAPVGQVWVQAQWVNQGGEWVYSPGHWSGGRAQPVYEQPQPVYQPPPQPVYEQPQPVYQPPPQPVYEQPVAEPVYSRHPGRRRYGAAAAAGRGRSGGSLAQPLLDWRLLGLAGRSPRVVPRTL